MLACTVIDLKKKSITMHRNVNVKFVSAEQANEMYQYRNTREQLYKTSAAILHNKVRREKQLTPNQLSVEINGKKPTMPKNNKTCHPIPPEPRIKISML
jgi:hypothetical protein